MGAIAAMVVFTTAVICVTIAYMFKNRRPADPQWGKNTQQVPPLFEKMFEKAASERDEKIRKLEDRIAVLEKIVTDNHGASKLADEIEKLRS
jgi:ribonucleotide reductase alpha subunit